MALIKAAFVRAQPPGEPISSSRLNKGERGIWQRRYWEHTLRDDRDVAMHTDYIHFNPVKHRQVTRVRDWPHSSFAAMVGRGVYPEDWGGVCDDGFGGFGELW